MNNESLIERRRRLFRERYTSLLFNSQLNIILVIVVLSVSFVYSVVNINWSLNSLVLIPIFFVLAEAIMYATHRWQQHKRIRFSQRIFEMHSIWHHGMFSNTKMYVESMKDMNMVIMPFFIHGFVISFIYAPTAHLFEKYLSSDVGWILMLSVTLQLIWYEVVHTASHLKSPPPLFSKLAIHHQNHHNAKLMMSCNFGIGTTLFDRILGTYHDYQPR